MCVCMIRWHNHSKNNQQNPGLFSTNLQKKSLYQVQKNCILKDDD
jgi:hypothetical protein